MYRENDLEFAQSICMNAFDNDDPSTINRFVDVMHQVLCTDEKVHYSPASS